MVVVVMVGVLGAQVELCKARGHTAGLAEGLGARDHGRRRRRRRGGGAVAAFQSSQVGPLDLLGRGGVGWGGGWGDRRRGGETSRQHSET